MKKLIILSIVTIFLILCQGCLDIETLPAEPRIEFRSFTVIDTTDILGNEARAGKLKFYFEDGDGDVGNQVNELDPVQSLNLFPKLYRKIDGIMVPAEIADPIYPSPYRIPYMERLGQNKILRGEITVVFLYLFYEEGDTIAYDFYLIDRALHESNTEITCEIPMSENGVYTKSK
jgi:hypothetical protein